jgi:hypothetical protein
MIHSDSQLARPLHRCGSRLSTYPLSIITLPPSYPLQTLWTEKETDWTPPYSHTGTTTPRPGLAEARRGRGIKLGGIRYRLPCA